MSMTTYKKVFGATEFASFAFVMPSITTVVGGVTGRSLVLKGVS